MFRVIIIDDEYLIRSLIRTSVDFQAHGFEIVGEAEDGQQALDLINVLVPDVMVLDINIPFLNGIEVARQVRMRFPAMKIIVLTGYGEFEYAQELIRIGVSDYVLKPLQPELFSDVLSRVQDELTAHSTQRQSLEKLQREAAQHTDTLKVQALVETLERGTEGADAEVTQLALALRADLAAYPIVVLMISVDSAKRTVIDRDHRQLLEQTLRFVAVRHFAHTVQPLCFFDSQARLIVITCTESDNENGITERCSGFLGTLSEQLDCEVRIGVSSLGTTFSHIHRAYQEALYALEERFFLEMDTLIFYSRLTKHVRSQAPLLLPNKDRILPSLRTGNRHMFISLLQALEAQAIAEHAAIDNVYAAYGEVVVEMMWYASENNLAPEVVFPDSINYIDAARVNETITDLTSWTLGVYDRLLELVMIKLNKRLNISVERAKTFIEENYSRCDLTIEEVAERLYINPSHLSKLFRRDMKCSMIEYLTHLRMMRAKEILDTHPTLPISEAARRAGYEDQFYFSKLFKKVFGLSPSRYVLAKSH